MTALNQFLSPLHVASSKLGVYIPPKSSGLSWSNINFPRMFFFSVLIQRFILFPQQHCHMFSNFFLFLIGSSAPRPTLGNLPGGRAHSLPADALHPTPGAGYPDARRDECGDQQAEARGGGGQLQKYRGMGEEKGHWPGCTWWLMLEC